MEEEIYKQYEEDLQKRVSGDINVLTPNIGKFLKVVSACTFATVLSLSGITCIKSMDAADQDRVWHSKEKIYFAQTRCGSKLTGITSYVKYRSLKSIEMIGGKYKYLDMVTCGSLFGEEEDYLDLDFDGKVDKIYCYGLKEKACLIRSSHYATHKEKFDEADKFFAKYLEELSK